MKSKTRNNRPKSTDLKKIDLLCSPRGTRKVSSKEGKHEENYTIKKPGLHQELSMTSEKQNKLVNKSEMRMKL